MTGHPQLESTRAQSRFVRESLVGLKVHCWETYLFAPCLVVTFSLEPFFMWPEDPEYFSCLVLISEFWGKIPELAILADIDYK